MTSALEHLENASRILAIQLKEAQEKASEEMAQLEIQKKLLREEREQFEEHKATILSSLQNMRDLVTKELLELEKKEKNLAQAEVPSDTPAESEKGEEEQNKPTADVSFIELDTEEALNASESISKKNKESKRKTDVPALEYDAVYDLASSVQNQPLKDLAKGMGLNDRFLYTNELFDSDTNTFNEAIKKLNNLGNLAEATAYLSRYNEKWDMENDVVKQFMILIQRRYL